MRPNIDIPWPLNGRLHEYAEENDLNLTEAYVEILERGLESSETPA